MNISLDIPLIQNGGSLSTPPTSECLIQLQRQRYKGNIFLHWRNVMSILPAVILFSLLALKNFHLETSRRAHNSKLKTKILSYC